MHLIYLLIFILLSSSYSWGAIVFVHSATNGDYSGGQDSTFATPALSTTTGNLVVFTIADISDNTTVASSVTDTAGNTYYNGAGCQNIAGSNAYTDIWYCKNCIGNAANVVTGHFINGGPQYIGVTASEYSGADPTNPFEVCAAGATGSGASVTTSSFSPAAFGNLNIATASQSGGGTTWSAGTNYATETNTNNYVENRVGAPAGAQTASANSSNTLVLGITVSSFKATQAQTVPTSIQNAKIQNATIQ